jgi:sensor c-di-GMP phosphodiesterase-like protein
MGAIREAGQAVRISGRWTTALVVSAVLLASIPLFALDRAFQAYMEGEARQRLDAQATGALKLVELRLDQASKVLQGLAAAQIDSCGPRSLEAMRLAVFTNTPLKGLSLLDDQGRELCTHIGEMLDAYALSEEYPLPDNSLALAAARFREINERAVRLRFERASGRSIAALIAIDALLPDLDRDKIDGGRRLRLLFTSGELIAIRPSGEEVRNFDSDAALQVRKSSTRYPIVMVGEFTREALGLEFSGLQLIARGAILVLLGFGIGLVWMSLRRNAQDAVGELRRAIREGEIIPYYQPTVDLQNGRVRGAEVLARWRRPDGSLVPPANIIPLAEQSGLIFELTRVLMLKAISDVGESYRDRPRLRLAFNVFADHFSGAKIVDDVTGIFAGAPIQMNQLILEVTERAPLPNLDEAREVIARLQATGAKVAIDDVGTGHGGLSYLMKLGVDIIKIDKMFIDAIGTERYSQTIIETLVELGRSMKMEVIAEGVETVEQVGYLRQKGVPEAQGYVFAPPLPVGSYLALVEAMERPKSAVTPMAEVLAGAA